MRIGEPATAVSDELDDLQAVARAAQAVHDDEVRLQLAVRSAREHGRSWNQLATALGVSRQAARQRFIGKVHT